MGGSLRDHCLEGAAGRFFLSLIFFVFCLSMVHAQIGEPRQDSRGRMLLAEAWAPVIFQDMADDLSGNRQAGAFEPSDALVDLFFSDPEDLKGNGEAIFRVPRKDWPNVFGQPPVYFSVIETKTHFYVNYFLYHALDTNVRWHAHDTENILVILKKDGGSGVLEAVITNAHGRPMIYAMNDDMRLAAYRMRSKSKFLKYLDRNSQAHHEAPDVEFVNRDQSQSIKLFSAMRSHAIYKFSSRVFSQNPSQQTSIYFSMSCQECLQNVKGYPNRLIGYHLVDFDLLMEGLLEQKPRADDLNSIFVRVEEDRIYSSPAYQDRGLPNYVSPARDEESPSANLFFVTSFKTPYSLADPASVHSFLVHSASGISPEYLYNFYLNPVESTVVKAKPRQIFSKYASVLGIAELIWRSNN